MGKAKMFKIRSIDAFENVFQNEHFTRPVLKDSAGNERELRGRWREGVFKNNNPVVLELACGKGDYAIALARKYPQKNFIGIDIKGARIYTGAKNAMEAGLANLAFARLRIENITNFFAPSEVDEIWITFPDPFPKKGDAKRRLSAHGFLERYRQIAKPGAVVHFKTDDLPLFRFTRESVESFGLKLNYYKEDIYSAPLDFEELEIKTYYERKHLEDGRTINYLAFTL
ncbi:MAG TPA: tRNA (guanosine(46)-N7)-methyltransferase TrmB [Chitinophagales bacterium]|nr:tRNA (guanosine(46)-N7)-methyltransferase TrmB [Chitinophagales bacterium]